MQGLLPLRLPSAELQMKQNRNVALHTHTNWATVGFKTIYLCGHILAARVRPVALRVGIQHNVQKVTLFWWVHVAIQNARRSQFPRVEPASSRQHLHWNSIFFFLKQRNKTY